MKNIKVSSSLVTFIVAGALSVKVQAQKGSEIISYGKTAVGSRYIWGGSTWNPQNRKQGGSDCAGLVLKAWRWPLEIAYTDTLKPRYNIGGKYFPGKLYTGTMLKTEDYNFPWTKSKDYSGAEVGDAYIYNNGDQGHIFLIAGAQNGMVHALEARGRKHGIGYFERSEASLKRSGYYLLQKKKANPLRKSFFGRNEEKGEEFKKEAKKVDPSPRKPTFHVVQKNESLKDIAKKYEVPVSHLEKLNASRIKNKTVKAGDKIQVS